MENMNVISDHELFKGIVISTCKDIVSIAQVDKDINNQDNKIDTILSYILSINAHQYFTLDNLKNISEYINNDLYIRDFIFNLTDTCILEFLGKDGDLDRIIKNIVNMIVINKNSTPKLYDQRIADETCFDKDDLTKILESNSYYIVIYYLVLYPVAVVSIL